jgi:VWFA-related protein
LFPAKKKGRAMLRSILRPLGILSLTCFVLAMPQQEAQKQPSPAPTQPPPQTRPAPTPIDDTPASIGILLDSSGSMIGKRDDAVAALKEFVKASNSQDEFFVVNFNDDPYLDQDFTSDSKAIFAALGRADARSGTALYDAILAAANHLQQKARYKKRAIIVVTDGLDNRSRTSLKQLIKSLQGLGMPAVYPVGLFSPGEARRARKPLDLLSGETGGMALYPENEAQLNEMSLHIAQEIRKRQ